MRGFEHIDTWIFDLDNTLYHASCRLFDQIDWRMTDFVARHLAMESSAARTLQKRLFHEYGTTLRGLMVEHDVDPEVFLNQAHDIDYSPVAHNPDLDQLLHALPGRKLIFTNGTVSHARNVLNRLGVTHHFGDIFDITHADYIPKPERAPYEKFIHETGITAATSVMFEDIARNLLAPHELGMTTVLVTARENHDANLLNVTEDQDYIDFTTDDLTGFLQQVTQSLDVRHNQPRGESHEKNTRNH